MKRVSQIILTVIVAVSVIGCNRFLDVQPRGNTIATTVDHYNGMFNTSSLVQIAIGSDYMPLWRSPEMAMSSPDDAKQLTSRYEGLLNAFMFKGGNYIPTASCPEIEKGYNHIYIYNTIANDVMNAEGNEQSKKWLKAEALVSQAYTHFMLASWYGLPYEEAIADTELILPIITKADMKSNDKRATMREMYDYITSTMEEWVPQLQDRDEHPCRVYMTTGYALLGKVYWSMGKYDKALPHLEKAMDMIKKTSRKMYNYREMQAETGYKEMTATYLNSKIVYKYQSSEVLWAKTDNAYYSTYFTYYGYKLPAIKKEAYAMFDEHDLRRNYICTIDKNGAVLEYPNVTFAGGMFPNWGVEYAELYLMLAECEARADKLSEAKKYLEELRSYRMAEGYASIPSNVTTKDDYIRFCVDEQTREYMGQGYSWYNVRRLWNDPLFSNVKYTHALEGKVYTMTKNQLKNEFPQTVLQWHASWK